MLPATERSNTAKALAVSAGGCKELIKADPLEGAKGIYVTVQKFKGQTINIDFDISNTGYAWAGKVLGQKRYVDEGLGGAWAPPHPSMAEFDAKLPVDKLQRERRVAN